MRTRAPLLGVPNCRAFVTGPTALTQVNFGIYSLDDSSIVHSLFCSVLSKKYVLRGQGLIVVSDIPVLVASL